MKAKDQKWFKFEDIIQELLNLENNYSIYLTGLRNPSFLTGEGLPDRRFVSIIVKYYFYATVKNIL